ncbi:fimbrial protein [Enterobacter sp. CC120223-11]|uniref:fimbrial protein n=1 Tax=Enterobacter sp. CC120223-11 TaxID=1378073 RepID=UPI000BD28857|nr:fimbrial protein [Enterobacter sp. CC120223-11]SNY61491.1 Pilin (type 1 fimbria component protein) [Enterobacter sp. CC120223-11]
MSSFISSKTLLSISLFSLLCSTAAVQAAEVSGGTVNFHGSVVTTACAISSNSADINVDLGEIRAANLKTAGSEAATAKNFSIVLQGCDSKTSTGVAITFSGSADSNDPTSLAVGANGGASTAQNVAIRLFDENGAQVKLGVASGVTTLRDGDNTLNFSAKYYSSKGNATAGDASAVATYTLTYS